MMEEYGRSVVMALVMGAALVAWTAQPAAGQIGSWTSDAQDFQVGDVISVLLDEYTLASADRDVSAEQERSRSLGAGASYDGVALGTASIETENAGRSRNRGRSSRQDRLTGEMTVRVVEIGDGGLLRVEGTKRLVIDRHEQDMTLSGWIRPEDVPPHNVMESWRIADAVIEYTSKGELNSPRQGLISRILGWIWP